MISFSRHPRLQHCRPRFSRETQLIVLSDGEPPTIAPHPLFFLQKSPIFSASLLSTRNSSISITQIQISPKFEYHFQFSLTVTSSTRFTIHLPPTEGTLPVQLPIHTWFTGTGGAGVTCFLAQRFIRIHTEICDAKLKRLLGVFETKVIRRCKQRTNLGARSSEFSLLSR